MPGRQEKIARLQAQWEMVDWADVATFIGPRAASFERSFGKLREAVARKGYGNAAGFCWPALVFGFAWFLARKQWAIGAILILLPMLAGLILPVPPGAMGGVAVIVAIYGKSFYLQNSVPKVARIVEETVPGDERDARLREAGGISRSGAALGGLLFVTLLAAIFW